MDTATLVSQNKAFGGWQKRFKHRSDVLNCDMHFSIYEPPDLETMSSVAVVYWLSGLSCTDQNFVTKAGAQRIAAELGLLLVAPDTSPRGNEVPDDENQAYDLGLGAGFYVNATRSPWRSHYRMYDYIVEELPALVDSGYATRAKSAIAGHSMGGHGALIIALSNATRFTSVSAFAPIVAPSACPWGQKAFRHYLGDNHTDWLAYDACHLLRQQGNYLKLPMRIDQGLADEFLHAQMLTRPLESVARETGYPAEITYHEGYDHSYYFVASLIEAHLRFHARYL